MKAKDDINVLESNTIRGQ